MFDIEYKGANCIVFTTKKSKLITDPKLSVVGLKDLDVKNAVEIATEERFKVDSTEATLVIEGPGEYEVGDFSIRGIATQRHLDDKDAKQLATVYRVEIGEVRVAVVGNIDAGLSEDQLESIGVVDMVVVPVGGNGYTLDATSAAHVVRAIDAKVIVPVHYADSALKYEVPQDPLEVFVKEYGGALETVSKYKVKGLASLPQVPTIIEITRS